MIYFPVMCTSANCRSHRRVFECNTFSGSKARQRFVALFVSHGRTSLASNDVGLLAAMTSDAIIVVRTINDAMLSIDLFVFGHFAYRTWDIFMAMGFVAETLSSMPNSLVVTE